MKRMVLLAFAALALASCFSPWKGDEGAFSIRVGGDEDGRALVPWNNNYDIENDLTHDITLSGGPGPEQTKSVKGSRMFYFSLSSYTML